MTTTSRPTVEPLNALETLHLGAFVGLGDLDAGLRGDQHDRAGEDEAAQV